MLPTKKWSNANPTPVNYIWGLDQIPAEKFREVVDLRYPSLSDGTSVCIRKNKNKKSRWLADFFQKEKKTTITPSRRFERSGANKANMIRKARPGLDQTTGTIEE